MMSDPRWRRARLAYAELAAADDPAAREVAEGAVDLRPGWRVNDGRYPLGSAMTVISGPCDLIELRGIVERMTGPGTWPVFTVPNGFEIVETLTSVIGLPRPASALALLMSMDGLIVDRSGAWRTWKTVVASIGSVMDADFELTFEALVLRSD